MFGKHIKYLKSHSTHLSDEQIETRVTITVIFSERETVGLRLGTMASWWLPVKAAVVQSAAG